MSDYREEGGRSGSSTNRRCELRFWWWGMVDQGWRRIRGKPALNDCIGDGRHWVSCKSKLGARSLFLELRIREVTCRSKFVLFYWKGTGGWKRSVMSWTANRNRNRKSSRHRNEDWNYNMKSNGVTTKMIQDQRQWRDSWTARIVWN